MKKEPTVKFEDLPEQKLTDNEKKRQLSEMDDFDKKMMMRLPNTKDDSDSEEDQADFWQQEKYKQRVEQKIEQKIS